MSLWSLRILFPVPDHLDPQPQNQTFQTLEWPRPFCVTVMVWKSSHTQWSLQNQGSLWWCSGWRWLNPASPVPAVLQCCCSTLRLQGTAIVQVNERLLLGKASAEPPLFAHWLFLLTKFRIYKRSQIFVVEILKKKTPLCNLLFSIKKYLSKFWNKLSIYIYAVP